MSVRTGENKNVPAPAPLLLDPVSLALLTRRQLVVGGAATALRNTTADSLVFFRSGFRFLGRGGSGAGGRRALAGVGFCFQGRCILFDDAEAAFDGVVCFSLGGC